jgi:hypothetical protein
LTPQSLSRSIIQLPKVGRKEGKFYRLGTRLIETIPNENRIKIGLGRRR